MDFGFRFDLKGKRFVVTGGSRGIGQAIVKALAQAQAQVAFSYRSQKNKAQALLESLPGEGHFCFSLDMALKESREEALSGVTQKWNQIHGLVNNAGLTEDQILMLMTEESIFRVIQVNLIGSILWTKGLLRPLFRSKEGASIVNITSVTAQVGSGGQSNYTASKGGLESFSRSLARELAKKKIRVNCIAPGFIETNMTDSLSAEQKKAILDRVPLQRLGGVQDITGACLFLLSDLSSYITGHTLNVNGGMYMH